MPQKSRVIRVKGRLYQLAQQHEASTNRQASSVQDDLLAIATEIQDYAIPNLENWTDLANRALAALEQGKDSFEVAGKKFTAAQLVATLQRLLRDTQQAHQQLWQQKERDRTRRNAPSEPRGRSAPTFYHDPEYTEHAVPQIKPPTPWSIASVVPAVRFRGAVYRLTAAPQLPPEYNIPVDLDPEVVTLCWG